MEDWTGALPTSKLSGDAWKEKTQTSGSSSSTSKFAFSSSRFSFNGIDRLTFSQSKGAKPDWELSLPPIEYYKIWESGAWSGLSLSGKELHHFYIRAHRRGPEPKYRVYSLSPDWEVIDFIFCSKKDALLLEKSLKAKDQGKTNYRLLRLNMLSSQELKRESAWEMEAPSGQEYTSLKTNDCSAIDLEGWPKSYSVNLVNKK